MTNTSKLKEIIKLSGYKNHQIAAHLNISLNGLNKRISGSAEFKASEIEALSKLLKLGNEVKQTIFFI